MIGNIIVIIFFGTGLVATLHYMFRWLRALWIAREYLTAKCLWTLKGYYVAKCICPSNASCENCSNYIRYKDDSRRCLVEKELYKKLNLCLKWKTLDVVEGSMTERVLSKTW